MTTHPPNSKYPDATAVTYDEQNFKVTVVYNDHSIYVWDVRDIKKVQPHMMGKDGCKLKIVLGARNFSLTSEF